MKSIETKRKSHNYSRSYHESIFFYAIFNTIKYIDIEDKSIIIRLNIKTNASLFNFSKDEKDKNFKLLFKTM